MRKIKVLLVDDHSLFRKGFASLLSSIPELVVVGEGTNGQEGIELALQLKPDLIIMDVEMPAKKGVDAVKDIKRELPHTKIVMLTISEDDNDLFVAIKNGAQGYLLKNMDPDEILKDIRGVLRGEPALPKVIAGKILKEFAKLYQEAGVKTQQHNLTEREHEVLRLVAQGSTNKEIASILRITDNTVKNHLCNIMEKLHLQNRVQIAAFAWREGLVN